MEIKVLKYLHDLAVAIEELAEGRDLHSATRLKNKFKIEMYEEILFEERNGDKKNTDIEKRIAELKELRDNK